MEVIKGFPSLPVLDKQFLVMWFLVLVYLFFSLDLHICRFSKFYHHCHILKIFRVISPTLIGTLPKSSLEIFMGISYISKALFSAISLLSIDHVKYIVTLPARSST